MGRKKDGDDSSDVEFNAISEGIAAIGRGDFGGGADALRLAQELQERRDPDSRASDRKK